jgi:hypothetical protein
VTIAWPGAVFRLAPRLGSSYSSAVVTTKMSLIDESRQRGPEAALTAALCREASDQVFAADWPGCLVD